MSTTSTTATRLMTSIMTMGSQPNQKAADHGSREVTGKRILGVVQIFGGVRW